MLSLLFGSKVPPTLTNRLLGKVAFHSWVWRTSLAVLHWSAPSFFGQSGWNMYAEPPGPGFFGSPL